MADVNLERWKDDAEAQGRKAGESAATWFDIQSYDDAVSITTDIDPKVLDRYEAPAPFSGEWADGITPHEVWQDVTGLESPTDEDSESRWMLFDEVANAYEDGFRGGFQEALDIKAAEYLEDHAADEEG